MCAKVSATTAAAAAVAASAAVAAVAVVDVGGGNINLLRGVTTSFLGCLVSQLFK